MKTASSHHFSQSVSTWHLKNAVSALFKHPSVSTCLDLRNLIWHLDCSDPQKIKIDFVEQEEIVDAIKKYVSEHPQASDTIEGIMNWWIGCDSSRLSAANVQQALDDLCERQILQKKEIPNSLPLYCLKSKGLP